jgi:hypothetical protein
LEGALEEASRVEEVLVGDEADGNESHGPRQEERGTNGVDNIEEEEATEELSGRTQPSCKERDLDGTTSDKSIVNDGQPVTQSSNDKIEGAAKRLRKTTKEEKKAVLRAIKPEKKELHH